MDFKKHMLMCMSLIRLFSEKRILLVNLQGNKLKHGLFLSCKVIEMLIFYFDYNPKCLIVKLIENISFVRQKNNGFGLRNASMKMPAIYDYF